MYMTICAIRGKPSDTPDGEVFHLPRVTGADLSESSLRHAAHFWKGQLADPASLRAGCGRGTGNQPQFSPFIRWLPFSPEKSVLKDKDSELSHYICFSLDISTLVTPM